MKKTKIIIFGMSDDGKELIKNFFPLIISDLIEIVCISDNDSRLSGKEYKGIPIKRPDKIIEHDYDKIIVTPIFFDSIKKQLKDLGVAEGKIIPYYNDYATYFSKTDRKVGSLEIGKYSYFKPSTKVHNTKIGSFCHIGADCIIGQLGHDPTLVSTYPLRYHFSEVIKDVTKDQSGKKKGVGSSSIKTVIGNNVYIGTNVIIKAGVKVGDGSIIASQANVTKDVESYSIVGGVPAKVIRKRFANEQIKKLLQIKWWDQSENSISENISKLEMRIGDFLNLNTFELN